MQKWRKIMTWIIGVVVLIAAFWFYNFRWVELIPLEYKDQGPASFKNPYIERPDWITGDNIECFKRILKIKNHDYLEKNGKLYIRAYLARYMPVISDNWIYWGGDNKDCISSVTNNPPLGRDGFFPKYTGHNSFSLFLDRIVMWNGDKPTDKK